MLSAQVGGIAGFRARRSAVCADLGVRKSFLKREVAAEARARAFDGVVEQVDVTTGAHVPKRQAEELVVAAAPVPNPTILATKRLPR